MKKHPCPYTRTACTCSTACRLHDQKAGLVRVPEPNKKP